MRENTEKNMLNKLYKKIMGLVDIDESKEVAEDLPQDMGDYEEGEVEQEGPKLLGGIYFNIFENGMVDINCTWEEYNTHTAMAYGEMLYRLNVGDMRETIVNILAKESQNGMQSYKFVEQVLKTWLEIENRPIVHPLQVFGASTHIAGQEE